MLLHLHKKVMTHKDVSCRKHLQNSSGKHIMLHFVQVITPMQMEITAHITWVSCWMHAWQSRKVRMKVGRRLLIIC